LITHPGWNVFFRGPSGEPAPIRLFYSLAVVEETIGQGIVVRKSQDFTTNLLHHLKEDGFIYKEGILNVVMEIPKDKLKANHKELIDQVKHTLL
jgi:hypothetical protein